MGVDWWNLSIIDFLLCGDDNMYPKQPESLISRSLEPAKFPYFITSVSILTFF